MKQVGQLLVTVINIYFFMLIVRIILSWLRMPQTTWVVLLRKATDPVIEYFRKKFPLRIGPLDISIIIPLIVLSLSRKMIFDLMISGVPINIFYFVSLFILVVDSAFSFIAFILFILTVILLVVESNPQNTNNMFAASIRSIINPILNYVKSFFKINSKYSERIYLLILLVLIIAGGFIGHAILMKIYSVSMAAQSNLLQNMPLEDEFDFK